MNKTIAEMSPAELLDHARTAPMADETRLALLFVLDPEFRAAVTAEVAAHTGVAS